MNYITQVLGLTGPTQQELQDKVIFIEENNDGEKVLLNVGGALFQVSPSIFMWDEPNFFTGLLSGRWPASVLSNGEVFVDRQPTVFHHIVTFFQKKQLHLWGLRADEWRCLAEDAQYYSSSALTTYLQKHFPDFLCSSNAAELLGKPSPEWFEKLLLLTVFPTSKLLPQRLLNQVLHKASYDEEDDILHYYENCSEGMDLKKGHINCIQNFVLMVTTKTGDVVGCYCPEEYDGHAIRNCQEAFMFYSLKGEESVSIHQCSKGNPGFLRTPSGLAYGRERIGLEIPYAIFNMNEVIGGCFPIDGSFKIPKPLIFFKIQEMEILLLPKKK